jgi:type III pantothenate kinase
MIDLVAEVGNSRVKFGRCPPAGTGRALDAVASLPPDDPAAWESQLAAWGVAGPQAWLVAGVQPLWRDRLADWLLARGHRVRLLDSFRDVPITVAVAVAAPEQVGIDRLLSATAVAARVPADVPAVVINAGTAVTVDWLDPAHAFAGGVIFPGPRLMAKALHDYTALLPLVAEDGPVPELPATDTAAGIAAGIHYAIAGGIDAVVDRLTERQGPARVFLAGGYTDKLLGLRCRPVPLGPFTALEGLRLCAERLS